MTLLFFVTEDWYFVSHRLQLAVAAKHAGYDVVVVTRVGSHRDTILNAGLRLIPFELARSGRNVITELRTLLRLVRVIRRERPHIVHHVGMKPVLYGSIAARTAGTPGIINAIAGMGWLFSSGSRAARLLNPVVRKALTVLLRRGLVLVQNPDDASIIANLGVPSQAIRTIAGSGVDPDEYRYTPEPHTGPVVVLPARLLWDKGVGEFVAAARILRARGAAVRFVLAGDPDDANPSSVDRRVISEWIAEGIIEHTGWVSDMRPVLASSHIVCLPSYREGLPKALVEAAATGRAIVTTDVPGCRDIVRHGFNGLLVPPRDPTSLADAIERLLSDAEMRQRFGAMGRERVEQEFSSQIVIQSTLQLYSELEGAIASSSTTRLAD